ncbi:type II secretion system protein GspC [Vitiosangium sp. GDMCC 1.1324]|uniref:type II secretion system protein GspC n=1 Tax=Vitiosangium sp. (strain GDMCC 1.1324) TaxID=2138576 RepID=UPI000D373482|nr:type II secretion system protein GspC [Vitiosangium sp. GDMCC 1.1324]PTL80429.1 general secretion pathway protein GspC [Vitiosangium sp. GDMCC 1.1324]
MELFFRKYFWTVNLVFILLVALLAARTVNLFVESALTPMPSGEVSARQKAKPTEALASLDLKRLSELTGVKIPEPEPVVAEPTAPAVDPNAAPVKSGLRVKLLGTLVANDNLWSVASVLDMGNQRSTTYMVGDRIQGAEVIFIERERVIILNNSRKEFIDGQPGDGATPVASYTPPPVPSGPPVQPPNGLGNGIKAVSENDYEVPRTEIDRTLANLNDVAMQARIVPAFKDGQAQGFKLFSIRPDSIYSKIGVQNGDVIKRINGFELNSPEKALEVYTKLKEASRIEIELERNGSSIRKNYTIR